MCGIVAIYAYHPSAPAVSRAECLSIRDHMARRGPDGADAWFDGTGRVAMGHRRLAIIDVNSRSDQPMRSAQDRTAIVFNGEIYNYRALRGALNDVAWRTSGDTEVLLTLLARDGEAALPRLRGMYAFAFFDAQRHALLLARDPYGIKPLYVADDGWTLRVASSVRALLAGGQVSRRPEPAAQVGFLLSGSVPEPFTHYQQIRALPPGGAQWYDESGPLIPKVWAQLGSAYAQPERTVDIAAELESSVAQHLEADVPVAVFLSAGIDSSALLAMMRSHQQQQIQAITLGFADFAGSAQDETPLAGDVARHYGAAHQVRKVTFSEFEADLEAFLGQMDQPTIDGWNSWFVAKAAHEQGIKVALSGLGGDELFGGYPSFRELPRAHKWLSLPAQLPVLPRLWRQLSAPFLNGSGRRSPKFASLFELASSWAGLYQLRRGLFMPHELAGLLPPDVVRDGLARLAESAPAQRELSCTPDNDYARVAVLESSLYMRNQLLRDTDWASMAHSLEVRVPLVDWALLNALAAKLMRSPVDGKRALALAPKRALPASVVNRPKTGFTTPIGDWISRSAALSDAYEKLPARARDWHWSRRYALVLLQQFDFDFRVPERPWHERALQVSTR